MPMPKKLRIAMWKWKFNAMRRDPFTIAEKGDYQPGFSRLSCGCACSVCCCRASTVRFSETPGARLSVVYVTPSVALSCLGPLSLSQELKHPLHQQGGC